jgi:hypothetical protein
MRRRDSDNAAARQPVARQRALADAKGEATRAQLAKSKAGEAGGHGLLRPSGQVRLSTWLVFMDRAERLGPRRFHLGGGRLPGPW